MGNTVSSSDENKSNLADKIDDIASKYILSQTFDDMNKMSDKGQCDKMVVLTAKIIDNNLTPLEQKEVVNRMYPRKDEEGKSNIDKNMPIPLPQPQEQEQLPQEQEQPPQEQEQLPQEQEQLPQEQEQEQPPQLGGEENDTQPDCVKIAKFYVKIAHLFAAIMKTINPVIISVNKEGKKQKYDLMSKQNMPTDEEILTIEHNNFCTKRINSLLQESDYDKSNLNNISLSIKPRFCNINYDKSKKTTRTFYKSDDNSNNRDYDNIGASDDYRGGDDYDDDEREEYMNRQGRDKRMRGDGLNRERGMEKGINDIDKYIEDDKPNPNDTNEDGNIKKNINKSEDINSNIKSDMFNNNKSRHRKYKESVKDEIPIAENGSEVGIPELLKLYYDEYDEERNDYTGMSKEMKDVYAKDLDLFYKTFTGKNIPLDEDGNKTITNFEQIPLIDFHNNEKCKEDGLLTQKYDGTLKDKLFREYAFHVKEMTNRMNTNQDKLLKVLDKLFTFKKPQKTKSDSTTVEEQPIPMEENQPIPSKEEQNTDSILNQLVQPQEQSPPTNVDDKIKQMVTENPFENQSQQMPNEPPQVGGIKEVNDVTVRLNPELDESLLNSLIKSTREIIVEMYITCETDFLKGITLFEGIVAAQLANTTTSKIRLLNDLTVGYLHNSIDI